MSIISGNSVILRCVRRDDLEMLRQWRNSPEVASFMVSRGEITPEQQQAWFERIASDASVLVYVIETKKENRPIGSAYLTQINMTHRKAECGLYIGDTAFRSNIFGLEALFLVIDQAFSSLNLHKVYGHYLIENEVARRQNDAFGFLEEGRFRDELFYDDSFHDYIRVGVLKEEFYASQGAKFFMRRR